MNEIDLDFDDDLEADAKMFGQRAQGDAVVASEPPVHQLLQQLVGLELIESLEGALHIAQEVYGETNSAHGEMFYRWTQAALEGQVSIEGTQEMLMLLHRDKESFGGRASWKQSMKGCTDVVRRLRARRHAAICAMNVVRAVLNKLRGQSHMLWVRRSLWRASEAAKDVKSEA